MTKNRKKKSVYLSPQKQDAAQFKAFCLRLQTISEKMVGPGYFELIPLFSLKLMFMKRYPRLTVNLDNGVIVGKEEQLAYKKMFASRLKYPGVDTLRGEKIEYMFFFSEVLLLVTFIEYISPQYIKEYDILQSVFKPYFVEGEWFATALYRATGFLSFENCGHYDMYKGTVQFDLSNLLMCEGRGINEITLVRIKNNLDTIELNGIKRPIAQLGQVPFIKGKPISWVMIRPDQLGLTDVKDNSPKPIFVQQHALRRLEERALCGSGHLQIIIAHIFSAGTPHFIVGKEHILLECKFVSHKIGYFVISFLGDKWLLRTFLFLTNEGTPEGDKLKELTALDREDKKYLEIDRMDAFLKYDIENDQRLKDIFMAAGCQSLFGYAKLFARKEGEIGNAEHIAQYFLIN